VNNWTLGDELLETKARADNKIKRLLKDYKRLMKGPIRNKKRRAPSQKDYIDAFFICIEIEDILNTTF